MVIPGRRQRRLAHVIAQVEPVIVDPVRVIQAERHLDEPPPQRRQEMHPLPQQFHHRRGRQPAVRRRARVMHRQTGHVPGLPGIL
jgi:hypothetical protein